MSTHSNAAVDFLRLAASVNVREAFQKYAGHSFRPSQPFFKGDPESLLAAMRNNVAKNPDKVLEIQRVIEEDDLVAVHSHVRMNPADRGVAVVHIFRFDGNHRIAELWEPTATAREGDEVKFATGRAVADVRVMVQFVGT
ncbi:MAG TPA: nuclear transport factor 2 family protein [Thermoanaerobaculia bacterium]|nr:nuclear transport factor 2 family protein [Thermoanaerobaculia bacterium]